MQVFALGILVVQIAERDGVPQLAPLYLGLTGLARAIPGLAFTCVALAHALTFFDFTYYYLKLPFLVVFAASGLASLRERGPLLAALFAGLAVAGSAALLLGL